MLAEEAVERANSAVCTANELVAKANSLQSLSRRELTVLKDLYERVDEDYVSYPEVKYFHDELNECEQSLMVALNDLDTSQRRVEELESSIKGSLRGVEWAREYYYEMAEELNRDKSALNFCTGTPQQSWKRCDQSYGPLKPS